MSMLPSLESVLGSSKTLEEALSTLFEPSTELKEKLVPELHPNLSSGPAPTTYSQLIDLALSKISTWSDTEKSGFISSHPRIGEVKGLSKLSAQEQATAATPPDVLARLEHLNTVYEERYPGLRYIVFVDGRTRAEIIPLIEQRLGIASLEGESSAVDFPPVETIVPLTAGDEEWELELERAIVDVGRIAKSRLKGMGVN